MPAARLCYLVNTPCTRHLGCMLNLLSILVGVVAVPDRRLDKLAEIYSPDKVTPAVIEFVDIAGLFKGASKG